LSLVFRTRIRARVLGAILSASLRGACGRPVGRAGRWSRTGLSPTELAGKATGCDQQPASANARP